MWLKGTLIMGILIICTVSTFTSGPLCGANNPCSDRCAAVNGTEICLCNPGRMLQSDSVCCEGQSSTSNWNIMLPLMSCLVIFHLIIMSACLLLLSIHQTLMSACCHHLSVSRPALTYLVVSLVDVYLVLSFKAMEFLATCIL